MDLCVHLNTTSVSLLTDTQVVGKVLRQVALERKDEAGLDYAAFKERLFLHPLNEAQLGLLNTRLQILESFMNVSSTPKTSPVSGKNKMSQEDKDKRAKLMELQKKFDEEKRRLFGEEDIWSFKAGSLTIVDLSCPFVDESAACDLFNICIGLFLEERGDVGRIVVLDEAHKV